MIKKYYKKIFPDYIEELKKAIGNCESLLDVGCGSSSPVKFISRKMHKIGVDAFLPSIKKSEKEKIHDEYFNIDVLEIGKKFKKNSFDCVVALDLIEHLSKEEGLKLIKMMENIARKKIIIFTPNGFLKQKEHDNNPWQIHKSGWTIDEMKSLGYNIIGINGLKFLKGERAETKFKPKLFWNFVSDFTQLFTKKHSKYAFQILCIKEKNENSLLN